MFENGTWTPYAGREALYLAVALLVISGVFAYLGTRLRGSLQADRPGKVVRVLLVVMWLLSLATLIVAVGTYVQAFFERWGNVTLPANHVSPITDLVALATFIVIATISRHHGWKVALGSAFVGAAAAPMIFELPFDLIVIARVLPRPPVPTAQLTLLYFLPLFLWELASYSLLTLSPATRLSHKTLFALAAVFLVFGIWALAGFSYPSTPIPIALNAISKMLSFVAAITLFLPEKGMVAA